MKKLFFTILAAVSLLNAQSKYDPWVFSAPAKKEFTKINQTGTTIIPNGRFITPLGKNILTAPHPYGLALSPDGNIIVTANSGTEPLSITIIKNILGDSPEVRQV
ncbi:MAG: hypothetical protein ACYC4T_04365, partial [Melioribacteraceae bacterium]